MLTLVPEEKLAMIMDIPEVGSAIDEQLGLFDLVRRLVREGSSGSGKKFKPIGKKEIGGKTVVGFREGSDAEGTTVWADPRTARLVCVEMNQTGKHSRKQHTVMNNFRYDVELDPSLFSLEPPASYATAVNDDLVYTLRFLAEHNHGTFPLEFGLSNYMQPIQAAVAQEIERLLKTPEAQKLREKLKASMARISRGSRRRGRRSRTSYLGPSRRSSRRNTGRA